MRHRVGALHERILAYFPSHEAVEQTPWTEEKWVQELFRYWTLPGTRSGESDLRIGIRDGYLNLYARGQSVAAFKVVRGKGVADVSETYVAGRRKAPGRSASRTIRVPAEELRPEQVRVWIETALSFAGDEKRFVEDLVAVNPNVIDLEMALSTPNAKEPSRRVARMDVVVVEETNGRPAIAFWEAKCANNGELRARGDDVVFSEEGRLVRGPHVAGQLRDYEAKMRDAELALRVGNQYREAAKILCRLCMLFDKGEPPRAWSRLASWDGEVKVLPVPGLVIGDYVPAGSECTDDFARKAETFRGNNHQRKLEDAGYKLVSYGAAPLPSDTLPSLGPN